MLMCIFQVGFAIWGRRNSLGSEILRSQMHYMWSEIWGRRDYWVSNISSMSLSKPFSLYQLCFQTWTADYLGSLESWSGYLKV